MTKILLQQHFCHQRFKLFICFLNQYQFMKKKTFYCNICDASFTQKGQMSKHVASVQERKKAFQVQYICYQICKKDTLKCTFRTAHNGQNIFKCNICYASFTSKISLNRHRDVLVLVHEGKSHSIVIYVMLVFQKRVI